MCDIAARSLVAQLDAPHISWKAYFEDLTLSARSRVVDFDEPQRPPSRAAPALLVDRARLPHDGHDGSLREADRYASVLVPRVLRALGPRGVLRAAGTLR